MDLITTATMRLTEMFRTSIQMYQSVACTLVARLGASCIRKACTASGIQNKARPIPFFHLPHRFCRHPLESVIRNIFDNVILSSPLQTSHPLPFLLDESLASFGCGHPDDIADSSNIAPEPIPQSDAGTSDAQSPTALTSIDIGLDLFDDFFAPSSTIQSSAVQGSSQGTSRPDALDGMY